MEGKSINCCSDFKADNPISCLSSQVRSFSFIMNDCFADCVAETSHSAYASLPKTGKPRAGQEWTLLSTVVQADTEDICNHNHPKLKVVALGTGSKCIGQNKMSEQGDVLNDSHAEVVARRAFLRYLYHQICITKDSNPTSIFNVSSTGIYNLRSNITFHFYTSHTPCGDASIFPKGEGEEDVGCCLNEYSDEHCSSTSSSSSSGRDNSPNAYTEGNLGLVNKRSHHEYLDSTMSASKRLKVMSSDIHRTGAKCVPNEHRQDPKLAGLNYHVTGAVRTKPGRGDPTLSVSCSDKLMRWNCVGVQGALLSRLLANPIYFESIIIGGGCPFSMCALERALISRVSHVGGYCLPNGYKVCHPFIRQAAVPFPDRRTTTTNRPCSSSIIWCAVPYRELEVAVDGRKQGVTKKTLQTKSGRLMICKQNLLYQFIDCYSKRLPIEESKTKGLSNVSYSAWKGEAQSYHEAWQTVLKISKLPWTKKARNLELFTSQ